MVSLSVLGFRNLTISVINFFCREQGLDGDKLLHVAGGPHTGLIINKLSGYIPGEFRNNVELYFSVWLSDGHERKQEKRTMKFSLGNDVELQEGRSVVHNFFKQLMTGFPKDYVSFMMRVLKMMQNGFPTIQRIDIDFSIVSEKEMVTIPDAAQYGTFFSCCRLFVDIFCSFSCIHKKQTFLQDSGSEVEEVTAGHIQELLEHAFPNGLTVSVMTDALRTSNDEVIRYLKELEALGIAQRVEDEWLRVDTRNVDAVARAPHSLSNQPTVAIITCLFVEKQAVDALIDERSMVHKASELFLPHILKQMSDQAYSTNQSRYDYKSGGDSNVYTMGRIGQHRVVATKLASVGDSREATTSAGSITTRLLGNFQNIEHVFVVGVGGAVPHFTDAKRHARLGDVVISASMPDAYIYAPDLMIDRKTEAVSGFYVRQVVVIKLIKFLKWNPMDHIIQQIVADGGDELVHKWNETTTEALSRLKETSSDFDFSMPAPETDVLALPVGGGNVVVLPHPNQDTRKGAEVHLGAVGAMANFRRHVEDNEESIGALRAKFGEDFEVRAMDAGFDSVIAAIAGSRIDSWALIRGIADYQHGLSRASKLWQAHSAARAAAMLRVIIERLPAP
ncbi:hypothetical protein DICVIV_08144 [Dictyocaulus viviparus]|uniref:Winged helix-turn-helix domain-containing protein n=1 Tax=Dictyocaulus viviparus TaxID=29172 RepID=A0A0D8XMR9_DICVI|nr:hypothetical protein DICVIV_08144 [Dictyocaulus viviparus]